MQVQCVVPGMIIMLIPAGLTVVPLPFNLFHGFWPVCIYLIQKTKVCFFAILPFPPGFHFQGLIEQILLGCHDVDNIPQSLGIVPGSIHMDMYPAGCVYLGPVMPELAHNLLNSWNILIFADGRYHLHPVVGGCFPVSSGFLIDTGVTDYLPCPALGIPNSIGIIGTTHMGCMASQILGYGSCRPVAGQTGHFNFDAKPLFLQVWSPSSRHLGSSVGFWRLKLRGCSQLSTISFRGGTGALPA